METTKKLTEKMRDDIIASFESTGIKDFIANVKAAKSEDVGTFEMVITTENTDRMGEVILASGWDFEHYMKNPIVLWGHDYHQLPVGVTETLEKTADGKTVARGRFASHEFAQEVRKLYDAGIMSASSVGFIAKEYNGNTITKAELLEWSFVTVPANPYALTLLAGSSISINEMITKGFLGVKEAEPVINTPVTETVDNVDNTEVVTETPADPVAEVVENTETVVDEQPTDTTPPGDSDVEKALSQIQSAFSVLEKHIKSGSEYRGAQPTVIEDSAAVAGFTDYAKGRKILQDAATVLCDVLSQARHMKK